MICGGAGAGSVVRVHNRDWNQQLASSITALISNAGEHFRTSAFCCQLHRGTYTASQISGARMNMDGSFSGAAHALSHLLLLAEPSRVHWDATKNCGHYHIQSPEEKWSLVLFVWSNKTLSLNVIKTYYQPQDHFFGLRFVRLRFNVPNKQSTWTCIIISYLSWLQLIAPTLLLISQQTREQNQINA